jgi:hypothetical protein
LCLSRTELAQIQGRSNAFEGYGIGWQRLPL